LGYQGIGIEIIYVCVKVMDPIKSFTGERVQKIIHSVLPITSWLPNYKVRENLLGDLVGGITVGIVHLPQGNCVTVRQ